MSSVSLVVLLKDLLGDRFEDHRDKLPQHRWKRFSAIDSRLMPYMAVHHTAGNYATTWEAIAYMHIDDNGRLQAAGIGYHFGIQYGKVSYLGSVDTKRAHVLARNHEALGICIAGNYVTTKPCPEDLAALHTLIYGLDLNYGHRKQVVGHKDLMTPGYTQCPGDAFWPMVSGLNYRLKDVLVSEAAKHQVVRLNPGAALQKAILAAGPSSWQITSGEFTVDYGGVKYVCQRAEHIQTGAVRVFYVPFGQWGRVSYVER